MTQLYRRKGTLPMRPYVPGESLDGISVGEGVTPAAGGMIAHDPANPADQWYMTAEYFAAHYEPAEIAKG